MKKWIGIILLIFLAGIGFMVYRYASMDVEDYVKLAEKFKEKNNYDSAIFSLEKALEKSLSKNGNMSEETAKIYRKLGSVERDLTKAAEYFDRAYLIHEIDNQLDEALDTLFEKGVMWIKGLPATAENMEEAFKKVTELYQENEYENSDSLVLCYYYLSYYNEDPAAQIEYYKKGEAQIGHLSPGREREISRIFYEEIAWFYANRKDFDNALAYCDKLEVLLKDVTDVKGKAALAGVYRLSGICMIYTGDQISAKERLEKSITMFEELESQKYYTRLASAYTYLALSYSYQNEPDAEKMMECGKTAFSYYTDKETLTNIDLADIESLKLILREAYEKVYPQKEVWEFDDWFGENVEMKATNYYFYTN